MNEYEMLSEHFRYEDGKLYRRKRVQGATFGKPVGTVNEDGYLQVKHAGKIYLVHTIVWILHKGCRPAGVLDHEDRNKQNNLIDNLRDVTNRANVINSPLTDARDLPPNIYRKRQKFIVIVNSPVGTKTRVVATVEEAIQQRDLWVAQAACFDKLYKKAS